VRIARQAKDCGCHPDLVAEFSKTGDLIVAATTRETDIAGAQRRQQMSKVDRICSKAWRSPA
jgi:hypothetical protein